MKFRTLNFIKRQIWLPFKLILKGFRIFTADISKLAFIILSGAMIFTPLKNNMAIGYETLVGYIAIVFISLFSTIFSTPSSLPKYGVLKININDILEELHKLDINQSNLLKQIGKNILLFKIRFKQRIIFFRTILGLTWAWNTYLYTNNTDSTLIPNNIVMYVSLLILFFILECYVKGASFIFKSIEFAIIEKEYLLTKHLDKPYDIKYNLKN